MRLTLHLRDMRWHQSEAEVLLERFVREVTEVPFDQYHTPQLTVRQTVQ